MSDYDNFLPERKNGNAELVLEEYEFTASTGETYSVKPIPFRYILKQQFSKDKLYIPKDKENPAEFQLYNINSEAQREKLNKWLKRLVFKDDDLSAPVDISTTIEDKWLLSDIGKLLMFIIEISGLSEKNESISATDNEKHNEYVSLFGMLSENGTMKKEEILSHSLPYLYAIAAEIQTSKANQMSLAGLGGFMSVPSKKDEQPKNVEELLAMVNG